MTCGSRGRFRENWSKWARARPEARGWRALREMCPQDREDTAASRSFCAATKSRNTAFTATVDDMADEMYQTEITEEFDTLWDKASDDD